VGEGDKLSVMTTVVDLLKSAGALSGTGRMQQGWPAQLVPFEHPDPEGPRGIRIKVTLEDRRDGITVMRLRSDIGAFCDDMDSDAFRRWMPTGMWRNTYGTVCVLANYMSGPLGEGKAIIDHVMPVEGLTPAAVRHVVSGFVLGWQLAVQEMERLKTRHAAGERKADTRSAPARRPVPRSLATLDTMVGLRPVKEAVRMLVAMRDIDAQRTALGLKKSPAPHHLVFTGNPGTGKTTVAKIIAEAYRDLGLLSKGHLVEVGRSDLVGAYIGHTAIRTKQVCEKALGGVLFIDEAYALLGHTQQDFGHEAIETLMTFMEGHRDDLVVIAAGYPQEMRDFLGANPGLESRFDMTIDFPDFSETELMEILLAMAAAADYEFSPTGRHAAFGHLRALDRVSGFANGREVRRIFERIVGNQSMLLAGRTGLGAEELRTLTPEAVPVPAPMGFTYIEDLGKWGLA